jgi:hypothetical protein
VQTSLGKDLWVLLFNDRLMKDGLMDGPDGGQDYVLDTPYLIVLEVKKSDTVLLHSSRAELLGQIRVLLQKLYAPSFVSFAYR